MAKQRINTALWMAATLLVAGAAVVVSWAVLAPAPDAVRAEGRMRSAAATQARPNAAPPIETFEPVWEARLRRTFADAELEHADGGPAAPSTGASPPLTLVGTIGTSLAMLRTPAAQIEVRGVGEKLLGAEIVAVRPAQVDLRYNGRLVTLSKPPEHGTGR
jgi:hypothetical protein